MQIYVTRMRTALRTVGTVIAESQVLGTFFEAAMSVPRPAVGQLIIYGSLRVVDLVTRELLLNGDFERGAICVPPSCPISLNGDSVRLRLVQPGDTVEIAVQPRSFGWIADWIIVRRPFETDSGAPPTQSTRQ